MDSLPTTIAELWLDFLQNCVPPHAGPVQRQETRNAFYAGAIAHSCLIAFIGSHYPPEQWPALSRVVQKELDNYRAQCAFPPILGGMQ